MESPATLVRFPIRLAVIHMYGQNQAKWADFVELHAQYGAIASRGYPVDLIVPRGTVSKLPNCSVRVHQVPGNPRNPLLFVLGAVLKLDELHRQNQLRIVWTQDPFVCGVIGWIASRSFKIPWIVEVCNDFFDLQALGASRCRQWLMGSMAAAVARRATRVRAVSESIMIQLARRGVPAGRIEVVCCPTDLDRFDAKLYDDCRAGIRKEWQISEQIVILFAGALVWRKGVDLLLEAADCLRHRFDYRLIIVGDGPQRIQLKNQAHRLGIQERVIFTGRVDQVQIPRFLSACDIFILPSRNEGLPRCLVEAMGMAKPVIATRISGNTEAVEDGISGILAEPTVDGIEQALLRMLGLSDGLRQQMGQAGRNRAAARYGLEANVSRMIQDLIVAPLSLR